MEFRLLGPVEIWSHGRLLEAGTGKQQAVLATLLLEVGRPVPADLLIDRVWGEAAPARARGTLQSHLSRIRRLLAAGGEPDGLRRDADSYRLAVEPAHVDVHRARELITAAHAAGASDRSRADLLGQATALWRGDPLSGLTGPWLAQMRETLRRQRLDVVVDWATSRLQLGEPAEVIDTVRPLLPDAALAEPLVAVLLRALVAVGRDAEALAVYEHTRRQLAEELGADPSAELRELHRAILTGTGGDGGEPAEPAEPPAARAAPAGPPAPDRQVPAQLPRDLGAFRGRGRELARLDGLLAAADPDPAGTLVVLSGAAGVGKTTLAVRWAHRIAGRFPDGQLHAALRGYAPGNPASPEDVLRGFLAALGVPANRVPAGVDAMAGLYRSLLAGRRTLVLLDNARDAEQVRPLLPGSPSSLVIITSRDQLPGLVAAEGAVPVPLAEPTADEARDLLAARLGTDRAAAEPAAVAELVAGCGRLPLALGVLAARAELRPDRPLTALAAELNDARTRLDALDIGDGATDVRAAFSWSYRELGPDARLLYRLTGLHPGPDLTAAAAGWLAGWPAVRARRALTELTRAHLLVEPAPGRYTGHDLLRAYAAELLELDGTAAERSAATDRLLAGLLHTAHAAAQLVDPRRELLLDPPPEPDGGGEPPTDRDTALDWLTAERVTLLAAVELCARQGRDPEAWHLAWCLYPLYYYRGHWDEQVTAQLIAVDAAHRAGLPRCEAYSRQSLATSRFRLGRPDEAAEDYRRVIALYDELGDPASLARAHLGMMYQHLSAGDHDLTLQQAHRALKEYEGLDDPRGITRALDAIGWCHVARGQAADAVAPLERALELHREATDRDGEAAAVDTLGDAFRALGEHQRAISCYRRAVELTVELGDRYHEAGARYNLGDAYRGAGLPHAARTAWRQALSILDDLGHPDAAMVRDRLRAEEATPR